MSIMLEKTETNYDFSLEAISAWQAPPLAELSRHLGNWAAKFGSHRFPFLICYY